MKNKVFCIGKDNHDIKVDDLKQFGLTWGCSNAYGLWIPDRLVNTDVGLSHEIYRSGYCVEKECYFWEWVAHDMKMLKSLLYMGLNYSEQNRFWINWKDLLKNI